MRNDPFKTLFSKLIWYIISYQQSLYLFRRTYNISKKKKRAKQKYTLSFYFVAINPCLICSLINEVRICLKINYQEELSY